MMERWETRKGKEEYTKRLTLRSKKWESNISAMMRMERKERRKRKKKRERISLKEKDEGVKEIRKGLKGKLRRKIEDSSVEDNGVERRKIGRNRRK